MRRWSSSSSPGINSTLNLQTYLRMNIYKAVLFLTLHTFVIITMFSLFPAGMDPDKAGFVWWAQAKG